MPKSTPTHIPACLGGIYKITNTITGHCYVGSAQSFAVRWARHRQELNGNWHHSKYLQRAWNRYGADAFVFEMVEVVTDRAGLIPAEQRWIDVLNPKYNVCRTAGNTAGLAPSPKAKAALALGPKSRIGKLVTPETCARISAGQRGRTAPNKGISLTDEQKQKISDAKRGKPWTEARRLAQEKRRASHG